jgi:hypothetical protein
MIKRSIPMAVFISCPTEDYAQGVKDGIMATLSSLMHECDVIVRVSPYIEKMREGDNIWFVRARFTAREKVKGREKGDWIKINRNYYEEEMSDNFDIGKEWQELLNEEIYQVMGTDDPIKFARAVEAKLKEKNK